MAKKIYTGDQARNGIIKGVNAIADAIGVTVGPSGHCVAIENIHIGPEITRDGATVAKSITFLDGEMNLGAMLVRNAAELTEKTAGDSTSTTSILIKEMCNVGNKYLINVNNVNELKSGMIKAGEWIKTYLQSKSIHVDGDLEKVRKVATISGNNDHQIGDIITNAISSVGFDGAITADLSSELNTTVEITEGTKIDRGYTSPSYATDAATGKCIMDDCRIFICGVKLTSFNQLSSVVSKIMAANINSPILIICEEIDEIADKILQFNSNSIRCCVVKGIDFGDNRRNIMQDIAVKVGANYISPDLNRTLESFEVTDLGKAKRVIVSSDSTVILGGEGDVDQINFRADAIRAHLNNPDVTSYAKAKFEKRLANLIGGVAIIRAGGATEVEKVNRKATIEDAILAAKSAIAEGCLPGGGTMYVKAAIELSKSPVLKSFVGDEIIGAKIIIESLPVVLKTIVSNSGKSSDIILKEIEKNYKKFEFGYNAKTGTYCNLLDSGILDSTRAVRVALENAVSTSSMILTTGCLLIEEDETKAANKLNINN